MKNLFDFATKELSQDAFLQWLFENYNCENEHVCEVARKLLSYFTDLANLHEIENLQTLRQWKYIDLLIRFEYNNELYCVAIEDKTYSEEHNQQLERYNQELNSYIEQIRMTEQKELKLFTVYYKSAIIFDAERERIRWKKVLGIKEIYRFFSQFSNTGSEILDDYIEHIKHLQQAFFEFEKIPLDKWLGNNIIYKQYCDEIIAKKFGGNSRSEIYHGKYTAAYSQKITSNGIVVEIAFFFRDWQYSTWIKCWKTGKAHNDVNHEFRDNIKNALPTTLRQQWERKTHLNRLLLIKRKPHEFNTINDLNQWIDMCLLDFESVYNAIEKIVI